MHVAHLATRWQRKSGRGEAGTNSAVSCCKMLLKLNSVNHWSVPRTCVCQASILPYHAHTATHTSTRPIPFFLPIPVHCSRQCAFCFSCLFCRCCCCCCTLFTHNSKGKRVAILLAWKVKLLAQGLNWIEFGQQRVWQLVDWLIKLVYMYMYVHISIDCFPWKVHYNSELLYIMSNMVCRFLSANN